MASVAYHIELRQFPHNSCHFNMTERELRDIVEPWSQERWVELGERKWNPHQAKLTILQGPEIPLQQLSMGRGWPAAKRDGHDVTERVLAAYRSAPAGGRGAASAPPGGNVSGGQQPQPASELQALLGDDPQALLEAWRHATALYRTRSPSESLALAEEAIRSSREE